MENEPALVLEFEVAVGLPQAAIHRLQLLALPAPHS